MKLNLLKENIGSNRLDTGLRDIFLDISLQVRETFTQQKKTINKTKIQTTKWEKIFAKYAFNKGLISKIYKEVIQLNTKSSD